MWFYHRVMSTKDADEMANSVNPEQSDLGLHCLPRPSVRKLRSITGFSHMKEWNEIADVIFHFWS